jgi:hypothetical protein
MTTTLILSIAITLVIVYLVLAIMITAINEAFFTVTRLRSRFLLKAIDRLFFDPGWQDIAKKIKVSPFINTLRKSPGVFPSVIPSANFTAALLGVVGEGNLSLKAIRKQVEEYQGESELYSLLRCLLSRADITLEDLTREIGMIYDNAMDRITEWFRRYARILSFGVAFLISLVLNIDTVDITFNLYRNREQAEKIAGLALAAAGQIQQKGSGEIVLVSDRDTLARFDITPAATADQAILTDSSLSDSEKISLLHKKLESTTGQVTGTYNILADLGIPMGWSRQNIPHRGQDDTLLLIIGLWILKVLGIFLTSFAASLGAPFWFDVLSRISPVKKQVANNTKKNPE